MQGRSRNLKDFHLEKTRHQGEGQVSTEDSRSANTSTTCMAVTDYRVHRMGARKAARYDISLLVLQGEEKRLTPGVREGQG